MWYWYHYFVIDFKVDYYRKPLQNCFKTSKQVLWQYSRVLHLQANTFSSIGTILLSITTILTGTVTMLVSFVQVNTPVVTSKCNNHEYCQNTCKFWSKTYKNCDNTWELCNCKYLVITHEYYQNTYEYWAGEYIRNFSFFTVWLIYYKLE